MSAFTSSSSWLRGLQLLGGAALASLFFAACGGVGSSSDCATSNPCLNVTTARELCTGNACTVAGKAVTCDQGVCALALNQTLTIALDRDPSIKKQPSLKITAPSTPSAFIIHAKVDGVELPTKDLQNGVAWQVGANPKILEVTLEGKQPAGTSLALELDDPACAGKHPLECHGGGA